MAGLADYEKNDPGFVQDLIDSQESVLLAAKWLLNRGFRVTVNPTKIRPSVDKMSEYSDGGDLEISERVEVKARSISFTCKEDFPFPTIIVDVAHAWDKASPKPALYLLFNKDKTHIAIVKRSTSSKWVKSEKADKLKGRSRSFYECPISLVEFCSVRQ